MNKFMIVILAVVMSLLANTAMAAEKSYTCAMNGYISDSSLVNQGYSKYQCISKNSRTLYYIFKDEGRKFKAYASYMDRQGIEVGSFKYTMLTTSTEVKTFSLIISLSLLTLSIIRYRTRGKRYFKVYNKLHGCTTSSRPSTEALRNLYAAARAGHSLAKVELARVKKLREDAHTAELNKLAAEKQAKLDKLAIEEQAELDRLSIIEEEERLIEEESKRKAEIARLQEVKASKTFAALSKTLPFYTRNNSKEYATVNGDNYRWLGVSKAIRNQHDEETTLYFVKVRDLNTNNTHFKIGVTTNTLEDRFLMSPDVELVDVVISQKLDRRVALFLEYYLIREFRVSDLPLSEKFSGYTEVVRDNSNSKITKLFGKFEEYQDSSLRFFALPLEYFK